MLTINTIFGLLQQQMEEPDAQQVPPKHAQSAALEAQVDGAPGETIEMPPSVQPTGIQHGRCQ